MQGLPTVEWTQVPLIRLALIEAKALRVLHRAGYVHRDIKPQNFFYTSSPLGVQLVIADFGLAVSTKKSGFGNGIAGTRNFMAPEACVSYVISERSCSSVSSCMKMDIFSLGLTFDKMFYPKRRHK